MDCIGNQTRFKMLSISNGRLSAFQTYKMHVQTCPNINKDHPHTCCKGALCRCADNFKDALYWYVGNLKDALYRCAGNIKDALYRCVGNLKDALYWCIGNFKDTLYWCVGNSKDALYLCVGNLKDTLYWFVGNFKDVLYWCVDPPGCSFWKSWRCPPEPMIAQLRIYKQLIELLERKKYSQDLLKKYKISTSGSKK